MCVAGLAQKHSETISCIWLHWSVALQRNEMNFKKHEHFHLVPCVKRFKGIGRIGTSISLRQETEPALLMSKSELVMPSTPSFLVLNPKGGIFESFLLSFGKFPALNQWAKSRRVYSYYTPILQDGHLSKCAWTPECLQRLCDCCDTLCGASRLHLCWDHLCLRLAM